MVFSEVQIAAVADLVRDNTPTDDGRCRNDRCGGLVVRKCAGFVGVRYVAHIPACEKCGKQYPFASDDVPMAGAQAFHDAMNGVT